MKISCQACGTKYTIADDKVRGRKVRVRCKSCSTPIVVDTAQAAAEAEAQAAAAAAGAPQDTGAPDASEPWTVNLSDTEQRTMTTDEIVTGYHSGTVTDDAFVWKDGMGDWVPLLEQPDLRAAIEAYGAGAPAAQPAAAEPAAPAAPAFPAPAADPSPYAAEPPWAAPAAAAPAPAPAPDPTPAVPAAARRAGGRSHGATDLFGGVESAGSEEEALRTASLPGSTAYDAKVTGARNENSVLFSLDSLKAGFAAPKPPPPRAGGPKPPGRPGLQSAPDDPFGMSQGNSGVARLGGGGNPLFSMGDNQALMMAPPPPPEPPPPPVVTDPVGVEYAPAPAAKKGPDKRVIVFGGAAALVLVLGIGIAVAVSGGKKEDPIAEADTKGEKAEKESDKDEKKSEEKKAENNEAKEEETKAEAEPAATAPSASAAEEKKPPTEEEKRRFAEAQKKEQEKKAAEKAPEKKELPVPTDGPPFNKGAAIAALSSAASASTSCKRPGGPTGTGKVLVTFAPSGRVTSANVAGGAFGGTPVGGCVASVFRRAKVPPFGGGPVTVSKSFSIKP